MDQKSTNQPGLCAAATGRPRGPRLRWCELPEYVLLNAARPLLMGGYCHARYRELLLGGVTRTIPRSMTLPVLMAH